jgi:uncharacterized membrane protein YfcA
MGGGIFVIPVLVLLFGVELRYAFGASLLADMGGEGGKRLRRS